MNRRNTLKNLALAAGGLVALPAWARNWSLQDLTTYSSTFTHAEEVLLASVADTIIPAGNSIGALTVGVDKFLQKLIDNCYTEDVRANVKLQLSSMEKMAQTKFGKSFDACDQLQREELLMAFSGSDNKAEQDFFNLMKSETIRGFNTSKEVMTRYLNYKIAPGHYYGCVDVNVNV
jgi:Gluconate 2-dehydrogenase subunit 3